MSYLLLAQAGDPAATAGTSTNGFASAVGEIGLNPFGLLFNTETGRLDLLNHPAALLDSLQQLHLVWAGIFVAVGMMSVLNGYRWHKYIVLTIAFLVGLGLGHWMSQSMEANLIVAACVGVLVAVIAWPLMRYAIACCGGLAGAFVGANAWTALQFPADTYYAGALIGLVLVGMLSFILYRVVIIVMTCVSGAFIAVIGFITLLMNIEAMQTVLRESFTNNTIIIPMLVLVTAVCGFVIQQNGSAFRGEGSGNPAMA